MKVKIDVSELMQGMFVCELDRPWTETSFLLQGVLLKNAEDISQFQNICEYVYIDAEKSDESIYPHLRSLSRKDIDKSKIFTSSSTASESEQADFESNDFQKELKVARKVHTRTRSYIDQALEDVRLGQAIDTDAAKELVAEVAKSITHSSHAMLWLTNMKSRDEYTSIHCMNVCI